MEELEYLKRQLEHEEYVLSEIAKTKKEIKITKENIIYLKKRIESEI